MSVVPAPSIPATQSVAAVAALVIAAAVLAAVVLQPQKWGVSNASAGDVCTYNCVYMP